MTPMKEPPVGPYIVMAAWYCETCEVAGRSLAESEVACWNCNGKVVVTAKPSVLVNSV